MLSSLSSSSGYGGVNASSTLQKFFAKADANSDASLTKDELVSALGQSKAASKVGNSRLSSAVDGLIGSLDTDSNGTLSATEFSSFSSQFDYGSSNALLQAQEASGRQQQNFQALYSSLDSDSSGGISQDELGSAVSSYLSSTGQSSTDSSTLSSSLFSSLDSDSDGSVSQDELTSALKSAESNRPPPPMGPPPDSEGASGSTSGSTSDRAQKLYSSLDGDGNGGVSQEELSSAVSSYLSSTGQSSTDSSTLSSGLFSSLDSDSDGSVSQDELTSALKSAESNRPPPPPMGPPPANDTGSTGDQASSSGSSGTSSSTGTSSTSSTGYDPLDTNQDGYVSAEERLAGTIGSSSQQSGVTSSRLSSGTLRFLMSSMNEVAA